MKKWEKFEIDCTDFLRNNFGEYVEINHLGSSNSNVSDIKVRKGEKEFFIEAKCSSAQCGQFVLLANITNREFTYSSKNKSKINIYSQNIINYMNKNFEEFCDAGTTGKDIKYNNCVDDFTNWILENYRNKEVKFFMTDNYKIFNINDFTKFFNVSAKYRIKKSGSSHLPKSSFSKIENYLTENYDGFIIQKDKEFYIASSECLDNKIFALDDNQYIFSPKDGKYEIRKLSKTFNANVIFSVKLKNDIEGISISDFIKILLNF